MARPVRFLRLEYHQTGQERTRGAGQVPGTPHQPHSPPGCPQHTGLRGDHRPGPDDRGPGGGHPPPSRRRGYRYRADAYYGGGEWVLLAARLGWYYTEVGQQEQAGAVLRWIEAQADRQGDLPEQVSAHLLSLSYYHEWEARCPMEHGGQTSPLVTCHVRGAPWTPWHSAPCAGRAPWKLKRGRQCSRAHCLLLC